MFSIQTVKLIYSLQCVFYSSYLFTVTTINIFLTLICVLCIHLDCAAARISQVHAPVLCSETEISIQVIKINSFVLTASRLSSLHHDRGLEMGCTKTIRISGVSVVHKRNATANFKNVASKDSNCPIKTSHFPFIYKLYECIYTG